MSVTITNVSHAVEKSHLEELFECCGEIKSIQLTNNGDSRSCVVTFETQAMADAATVLSGTPLGGAVLQVKVNKAPPALPPSSGPPPLPSSGRNIPQSSQVSLANIASILGGSGSLPSAPPGMAAPGSDAHTEQTNRTVYVGNLSLSMTEAHVQRYFSQCGQVLFIKMGGEVNTGRDNRFCFIEFATKQAANKAKGMTGFMVADRPIVVGHANNPIIKGTKASAPTVDKDKVSAAMRLVREAQRQIAMKTMKVKPPEKKQERDRDGERDRSRSPKKKKRSRDRSRDRDRKKSKKSRRSRSRSRERRRRRSRSRDRQRDRDRSRKRRGGDRDRDRDRREKSPVQESVSPPVPQRKKRPDRSGMFFDGYSWQPLAESVEKLAAVAASHDITQ